VSKYVKLAAIERMAKSMDELHEEEGYDEGKMEEHGEHECKCACCGAPCEVCNEDDEFEGSENEEESEDNEESY